jgi:hypothetical protein
VKKFLQVYDVLLIKIQNESNMTKWVHLAHDAYGGYFFSPCRQNRTPVSVVVPPLEQAMEDGLLVQKLSALAQNSVE